MKKVIISIFLVVNIYADTWSKLLHIDNGHNKIISKEFYLSQNILATTDEELRATLKLLNSKDGQMVACNYPARYIYLKNNNFNIPNFNLNNCAVLTNFLNSFKQDKISLVFTSEHTNSPSSAFGHIMLLFSKNNEDIKLGDAVHYAAKTNVNDGFFKYSYKGFNGKYKGYFIREPFFKKIYDYNILEQRYIYIYSLNFTKKDIKFLIYHLFELRKATFKYYFLNENCATQTSDLLSIVSNIKSSKSIYYLPIDTLKQYKNNITSYSKRTPILNELNYLINHMNKREKKIFYEIISTKKDIDDSCPNIVKEALVKYTIFYFRRFHIWFRNYDNIMKQSYKSTIIKDKNLDPLSKVQPTNLGIGVLNSKLLFTYRPLFIDLEDIQQNELQQSEIKTFSFNLLIDKNRVNLLNLDFIDMKSLVTQFEFYKQPSWSIYLGLNQKNRDKELKVNLEVGIGKTVKYHQLLISSFGNLGFDNEEFYINPEINVFSYLKQNLKIGVNAEYKLYGNNIFMKNDIFVTKRIKNKLFTLKYEHNSNEDLYEVVIKYNF